MHWLRNPDRPAQIRCGPPFIMHPNQAKAHNEKIVALWIDGKDKGYYPGWQFSLKDAVRSWVLNRAGHRCQKCGWHEVNPHTGRVPLQIHHEDGNAENARPENLTVLCPNCHSLTESFGSRNKSARSARPNSFSPVASASPRVL